MPKLRTFILFGIFLTISCCFLVLSKPPKKKLIEIKPTSSQKKPLETELLYLKEQISYEVRMGRMKLGSAKFSYIGQTKINGKLLNEMVMETRLAKFTDLDRIYSDPETLLPILVERDIVKLFSREKITEEYNQVNFQVKISKTHGIRKDEEIIQKDSPIHNVVLLPHYIRKIGGLEVGKTITANLPTRKLEIKLVSIENIKVPAGTFKAYRFESLPKQINIWITADERKIPLKIESNGPLGYSMLMKDYEVEKTIMPPKEPELEPEVNDTITYDIPTSF